MSDSANLAGYGPALQRLKSVLIVASLQRRDDQKAIALIRSFTDSLTWEPLDDLAIDASVWAHVASIGADPKLVFCHPQVLQRHPRTSLYYRCLSGLSVKAATAYVGAIGAMEAGSARVRLDEARATRMARVYNTFTCSTISGSTDWTLENGYRTVIATLGISLDGVMRNRVGTVAEHHIRRLLVEWLLHHDLIVQPALTAADLASNLPRRYVLPHDIEMVFGSEPDIAFRSGGSLLAVVEIKGGIDPAGALERYGAATKSFQHARAQNPRCRIFYLGAVFTDELTRRLQDDGLVEQIFDVIRLIEDNDYRETFLAELFHYTLRVM